jgi:Asp/Glu/hydantoin racemase
MTVELHPKFIVDSAGKRVSVILSTEEYAGLLEDLNDLATIAERRNEPTISHSQAVRELQQDGYLSDSMETIGSA